MQELIDVLVISPDLFGLLEGLRLFKSERALR